MVNINISLRKEACDYLKTHTSKSSSEVVLDFKEKEKIKKGSKKAILKFAGALKNIDWNKRKRIMKSFKKEVEKRL